MNIQDFDSPLSSSDAGRGKFRYPSAEMRAKSESIESCDEGVADLFTARFLPIQNAARIKNGRPGIFVYRRVVVRSLKGSGVSNRFAPANIEKSQTDKTAVDRIDIDSINHRAILLAVIRRRIDIGYYDSPRHLEKLADILIDRLNLNNPEEN